MEQNDLVVRRRGLALAAALCGTAFGCGGADSAATDTTTPEVSAEPAAEAKLDIAGRWSSQCMPRGGETPTFAKLVFDISATRWQLDYSMFDDEACTGKLVTVAIEGPYRIGARSAAVDGAYEGEFEFASKSITPHVDPLRDALASQSDCGSAGTTWTTGASVDVFESGCPGFGQYPRSSCSVDYDLVAIVDGKLRFGARPADNNMCSPERRPAALSPMELTRE